MDDDNVILRLLARAGNRIFDSWLWWEEFCPPVAIYAVIPMVCILVIGWIWAIGSCFGNEQFCQDVAGPMIWERLVMTFEMVRALIGW
jgi:hypothetical protein